MTRIPIDLAAPIACTADGAEMSARIEQLAHLRDRLASLDRTDAGLLLHFVSDADLEAQLHQFAADEKGCCQFWGFEVVGDEADLTLRWDGPPDVQGLLDELGHWFRSDEPLTALAGLL